MASLLGAKFVEIGLRNYLPLIFLFFFIFLYWYMLFLLWLWLNISAILTDGYYANIKLPINQLSSITSSFINVRPSYALLFDI